MRMPNVEEALGNPTSPAYIPNLMLDLGTEMDFRERLLNTLFHLFIKLISELFSMDKMESMIKEATGIEGSEECSSLRHDPSVLESLL